MNVKTRLLVVAALSASAAISLAAPVGALEAGRRYAATGAASVTLPSPAPAPSARESAVPESDIGSGPAVEKGHLSVTVDRAKIIRLPERTQTVIVGNPAIADLAIQKNGIVVVTGKSYGTTNLIALDSGGRMLAESNVSVDAPTQAVVTVQRGMERQSYSCTPSCQPSVILGDANSYFSETKAQADQRNQFARGQ